MADSDILISFIEATGGLGQIVLKWESVPGSPLPYLQLDRYEVWISTTNNRNAATTIDKIDNQHAIVGLAGGVTRYAWVRPRDFCGNVGDFLPPGINAGISATTTPVFIPGTKSITADDVQNQSLVRLRVKEQVGYIVLSTQSVPTTERTVISDTIDQVGLTTKIDVSGRIFATGEDSQAALGKYLIKVYRGTGPLVLVGQRAVFYDDQGKDGNFSFTLGDDVASPLHPATYTVKVVYLPGFGAGGLAAIDVTVMSLLNFV